MKKIFVLILLLQSFYLVAQEPPKMIKYNAKNDANIFYYNTDEVLEKLKFKKDEIANATKKPLSVYNDDIKVISFLNFQKLQELESFVNSMGKQASANRDLAFNIRKQIQETITPIRDSIDIKEKKLNKKLESILSEKQFKKWLKYQSKIKQSLLPKIPNSQNNQMASPSRNRNNRMRN